MKVRASYWAELSAEEGTLVPAGALAASKTKLLFRAYPEFIALEREMEGRLASALARDLTPDDVLDYYAERANGVTTSVSRPTTVEARSLEDAAEKLLSKSKRHA
jgi:hypothetical protein